MQQSQSIKQKTKKYNNNKRLTIDFLVLLLNAIDSIQVHDRQGMLVITSDNAVAKYARACGLKAQGSAEFGNVMKAQLAERIFADAKPAPTRKEVAAWSEIFKEPEPEKAQPKPAPKAGPPPPSAAELKKQRRMEQLRKQTKGFHSLGTNTTKTTTFDKDEQEQ